MVFVGGREPPGGPCRGQPGHDRERDMRPLVMVRIMWETERDWCWRVCAAGEPPISGRAESLDAAWRQVRLVAGDRMMVWTVSRP